MEAIEHRRVWNINRDKRNHSWCGTTLQHPGGGEQTAVGATSLSKLALSSNTLMKEDEHAEASQVNKNLSKNLSAKEKLMGNIGNKRQKDLISVILRNCINFIGMDTLV